MIRPLENVTVLTKYERRLGSPKKGLGGNRPLQDRIPGLGKDHVKPYSRMIPQNVGEYELKDGRIPRVRGR